MKKCPNAKYARDLQHLIVTKNGDLVKKELQEKGKVAFTLDGVTVDVVLGEDIFFTAADLKASLSN